MSRGEMFKNGVVFLPIEIVGQRNGVILARTGRFVQDHDPVRVRIRKRPQENRVDDAEDRSVRTDPERKRQDRNGCESRRFAELAKSKLKIAHIILRAGLLLDRRVWRGGLARSRRSTRLSKAKTRRLTQPRRRRRPRCKATTSTRGPQRLHRSVRLRCQLPSMTCPGRARA